ncbi:MAG: MBG domain-containing protein, partial [Candidatus Omnitrophota bacterium]
SANYSLTNTSASVTADITARALTVTADAKAKLYAEADPALTYQITSGSLVGGESLSGVLSRVTGENVNTYAIEQNTLTAGANYNLTYVGANLVINPATLTITANSSSKTYGDTAAFTGAEFTALGLQNGETIGSVTLNSSGAASTAAVGTYEIIPSSAAGGTFTPGNYTITYANGTLTIDPKALTVTGITADNKVYDGTANATLNTAAAGLNGVVNPDVVTLLGTGTGSFADKNAGTGKAVAITGFTLGGADAGNYTLIQPAATADIAPKDLTVSVSGINKVYDGTTTAGVAFTDDRIAGDALTISAVSTFSDKNAGLAKLVDVSNITLAGADSVNYNLTGTTASVTADITPKPVSVTVTAGQSKVIGEPDPVLTYTSDPLAGGDAFSGALSRAAGEEIGSYAIGQGTLSAGANYNITFNAGLFSIVPAVDENEAVNQTSNAINPRQGLPTSQDLNLYQVNSYTGAVYFYHPLTDIDMAAFDQFELTEDDYDFLGGSLNIVGHDGLLPLLK